MVITTGDPYPLAFTVPASVLDYTNVTVPRRTRADQPFTVKTTVTGLVADASKPACFRFINRYNRIQSFAGDGVSYPVASGTPITLGERVFSSNDTYNESFITSLPGVGGPRFACGTETFTTRSLDDTSLTRQIFAARDVGLPQTVRIWPMSSAEVLTYPSRGTVFTKDIPVIPFAAKNLYPLSTTYFRYYEGGYVPNKLGTRLLANYFTSTTNYSVNKDIMKAPDLNPLFNKDGKWTIVLFTETPQSFGDTLELAKEEIMINRTITVNTNLTTSE
jgi:hypothetical protein